MILNLLLLGGAIYVGWEWWKDLQAKQAGRPNPRAFPGTAPAGAGMLALAAAGGVALTGMETAGELALGFSAEQTRITAGMLPALIGAAVLEEVIFRGYLLVTNKGRGWLAGTLIGGAVLFALLHGHLFAGVADWMNLGAGPEEAGGATEPFSAKGWFSTGFLLLHGLWFGLVRIWPANPEKSLLPCVVAHLATNLAVFAIKAGQGFVDWTF